MLIRFRDGAFETVVDGFSAVADEEPMGDAGGVIVSLARLQAQARARVAEALGANRALGVRLEPDQAVEDLAERLLDLALVALAFPKFRDGRAFTSATLLRERYGFKGEVRAVGEVLREQAYLMVRCGFDTFEPADGSTPQDWSRAAGLFHHVYQAAPDRRPPAFRERETAFAAPLSARRD